MIRKDYLKEELSKDEEQYIIGIVKNTLNKYLIKNKYKKIKTIPICNVSYLLTEIDDEPSEDTHDFIKVINNYGKNFDNYYLGKFVNRLSFDEKILLYLINENIMTLKEISEMQNTQYITIYFRYKRILDKIKQELGDYYG